MAKLRCVLDMGVQLPTYFQFDDAIATFCRKEQFAFLADRFGYLNKFSRFNGAAISEGRFPTGVSSALFSDIMLSRATDILAECITQNKRCVVLWSGGCDSTSVISSLFAVCSDLSILHILHTASSIIENPSFYSFIKSNGISTQQEPVSKIFNVALNLAKAGNIVIYGFPADQLFGSIIGQTYNGDTTKEHWSRFIEGDTAIQQYEEAFAYYGLPIKTIAEFLWFNNFALKWDYVCNWTIASEHDTHDNIRQFFDTYSFENWSVSNFDILHAYDQKDKSKYKIQMKDFIFSIIKDSSVYSLGKRPSIAYACSIESTVSDHGKGRLSCIDDDNKIYTINTHNPNFDYSSEYVGRCAASLMRQFLKR